MTTSEEVGSAVNSELARNQFSSCGRFALNTSLSYGLFLIRPVCSSVATSALRFLFDK